MALHGEMLQERRSAILADFQSGKYALLVATGGLVGRGLDLPHCRQVDVCLQVVGGGGASLLTRK